MVIWIVKGINGTGTEIAISWVTEVGAWAEMVVLEAACSTVWVHETDQGEVVAMVKGLPWVVEVLIASGVA